MADKSATLLFQIPKGEAFNFMWQPFLRTLVESEHMVVERDSAIFVGLSVVSYNLTDHQFVSVKLNVATEKAKGTLNVLLPRQNLILYIRGQVEKRGFRFRDTMSLALGGHFHACKVRCFRDAM